MKEREYIMYSIIVYSPTLVFRRYMAFGFGLNAGLREVSAVPGWRELGRPTLRVLPATIRGRSELQTEDFLTPSAGYVRKYKISGVIFRT